MNLYEDYKNIIGKKLKSVIHDRGDLIFNLADGGAVAYEAEGECCSESWIEHLEAPTDLDGATVLRVEDSEGEEIESDDRDCLRVYQTHFITDRGHISVEFRNASNGYYGGYLQEVIAPPPPKS